MLRGAFAGEAPINVTMDEEELKALNQMLESWEVQGPGGDLDGKSSRDHVGKFNKHETI